MLQLASTCEAMGIPKDTVKTLRRWDRVHMIKELAGVAVSAPARLQIRFFVCSVFNLDATSIFVSVR